MCLLYNNGSSREDDSFEEQKGTDRKTSHQQSAYRRTLVGSVQTPPLQKKRSLVGEMQ